MTRYTDEDIPILCAECFPGNHYIEGYSDMVLHILEKHKNYSPGEARDYAGRWLEEAWAEMPWLESEWRQR